MSEHGSEANGAPENRPKLLVLASTYPRWANDPEPAFVHELNRRLIDTFDVFVVCPHSQSAAREAQMDGVHVTRYRYAPSAWETLVNSGGIATNLKNNALKWFLVPGFVVAQWWAARQVCKREGIDLIHAHWLIPQGLVARRLSRALRIRFAVTSHGGDLFGLKGKALTRLKQTVAKDSSGMTVVSRAMATEAQRLQLAPPSLSVIPMGVDLKQKFTPDPSASRAKAEMLFVGRLVPKKGLLHLVRALPLIAQQVPDAHLSVAGFGPELAAIEALADSLGVRGMIDFMGAVKQADLPALYKRASVFVAPFVVEDNGNQEGLPVTLMEAVGCGCPAVVGRLEGLDDLLGEDAAQTCVEPYDTQALATRVIEALTDSASANARALRIRARAVDHVDWESVSNRYSQFLLASLEEARNAG